nr:hypothetical protein [Tanacetum cinerariifolium]
NSRSLEAIARTVENLARAIDPDLGPRAGA